MMNRKEIPVVPARGGAEVALDLMIRPFSSIELACAVRRAPCVRALCELVVLLLLEKVTGLRPRWHATSSEQIFTLHTALFKPCASRFTLALHTPQFTSSQII